MSNISPFKNILIRSSILLFSCYSVFDSYAAEQRYTSDVGSDVGSRIDYVISAVTDKAITPEGQRLQKEFQEHLDVLPNKRSKCGVGNYLSAILNILRKSVKGLDPEACEISYFVVQTVDTPQEVIDGHNYIVRWLNGALSPYRVSIYPLSTPAEVANIANERIPNISKNIHEVTVC
ncbi:MAG: hypothetical protein LBJ92_00880 [Holosporales bacterium]|nr:hypothetical protein [Holosporales bacterium]